ncbi:tetratricopeptide repeat protein [uncultured Methanoregula sp.]|uniref:tetratricopeptide repeat protein n=1 Tax=uncultured Methanoregula sp. TaxID=1005933 RepID=UPI002AAB718C|nr:tetratricopeptide repeat protein [uncultured Methanoregula sp.]
MRLIWIVFLAVVAIIMVFVIIPTYAPTVTTQTVIRDSQATAGDALVLMNQSELAIMWYDNALAVNTSDPVLLKKKGEALIKCGRAEEAGQIYQQVLSDNRNDTVALVRAGDALNKQGNYAGALEYYDAALAVNPNDAKTWLRKGDTHMMISEGEQQRLHDVAKGFSKQPGSAGYQEISADQLPSMESQQKAVESYKKAMEIDPKLSVIVSARILEATQSQVSNYQSLLNDVQS